MTLLAFARWRGPRHQVHGALLVLAAAYRFDVGRLLDERPAEEVRSLVDGCAAAILLQRPAAGACYT